jgi:AraC-like DNA-binding protein
LREEARFDTAYGVIRIIRAAEALHGVEVASVLERAGVPASFIADPLHPLSVVHGAPLVEAAVALTRDPLLGLKAGRMTPLRRTLGLAGLFLTHAPNLGIALEKAIMVQRRTGNVFDSTVDRPDDEHTSIRVRRRIARGVYSDHMMDFHAAVGVTSSRLYSDPLSMPRAIEIPADRLEEVGRDAYEEAMGLPVIETVDVAGIRYATDGLRLALPVDADVFETLAPSVERELGAVPSIHLLQDVVSDAIERCLMETSDPPRLAAVARMLAMSPRTLQMRLREEDTSLRSLLDDVRGRLALRWLAQGIPRDEVSARLGFSESSAFRRACRRWAR